MIDASPPGTPGTPERPGRPAGPGRRSRRVAAVVVVAMAAGAGAAVALWPAGASSPAASAAASAAASPATPVFDAPTVVPRPAAGAPFSARMWWVSQEVTAMIREQSRHLLAGDFAGFSAVAAPGDRTAVRDLRRRFANLRALRVTRFDQQLDVAPRVVDAKRGRWRAPIEVRLCFVDRSCAPDQTIFDTLWTETPAGLRFTGYAIHPRAERCPTCARNLVRPWETTDLAVQVGARTLVAVPVRLRSRLPALTARAETAAALVDRFTIGDTKVDRYRIFVADDAAWKVWYTGYPGRWVAGQALPTGPNGVEVEVHIDHLTPGFTDALLRHELAHVATLRSDTYYDEDDVWWLVEGMADYLEQRGGTAADLAARRRALTSYLRAHKLRSVRVTPPADSASGAEARSRYAVGYYAVDRLMTAYGRERTLRFFQQAVNYGVGLDNAARTAFGAPWSRIDRECTAAVRAAAR